MKTIKNKLIKANDLVSRKLLSLSLFLISTLSYASAAPAPTEGEDIIAKILQGSIGKTLGKTGMIWALLIGMSFAVGGLNAALKQDPRAFISPFIITAIISTVIGMFLTF